ncbi:MAG: MarR family transcriptional regulator [Candidatus Aramenus sp.]|nr:MarR family transcriptional regulator [Candidatus Aramenus sp.]
MIRDSILALLYGRGEMSKEEIAQVLRQDVDEVEVNLKGLEREGLVTEKEKGIIFKKKVYALTPTGLEEAKKAKQDLEEKANMLVQAIQNGDYDTLQEYSDDLYLLVALSLVDAILLQDLAFLDLFWM